MKITLPMYIAATSLLLIMVVAMCALVLLAVPIIDETVNDTNFDRANRQRKREGKPPLRKIYNTKTGECVGYGP